jgi:hypothetical protein
MAGDYGLTNRTHFVSYIALVTQVLVNLFQEGRLLLHEADAGNIGEDSKSGSFQSIQSNNVRMITKIAGNRRDNKFVRFDRDHPDLATKYKD